MVKHVDSTKEICNVRVSDHRRLCGVRLSLLPRRIVAGNAQDSAARWST